MEPVGILQQEKIMEACSRDSFLMNIANWRCSVFPAHEDAEPFLIRTVMELGIFGILLRIDSSSIYH